MFASRYFAPDFSKNGFSSHVASGRLRDKRIATVMAG